MLKGCYFSSPNQTVPSEPFTEPQPLPTPYSPTVLRSQIWALNGYPYLAFCNKSPFQGELFKLLVGSAETMLLEDDKDGWHLSYSTAKSWKRLEHTLHRIARYLKEWPAFNPPSFLITDSEHLSKFGYFSAHPTQEAARSGLQSSLDAFVVYCAYISFMTTYCQLPGSTSDIPSYLPPNIHPEFSNMFKESHIVDFSGQRKCIGTIINVLWCNWISVAHILLKAQVLMWLYWGDHPLTVTLQAAWMVDFRPQLVNLNPPPVNNSLHSLLPAPPPSQPQLSAASF